MRLNEPYFIDSVDNMVQLAAKRAACCVGCAVQWFSFVHQERSMCLRRQGIQSASVVSQGPASGAARDHSRVQLKQRREVIILPVGCHMPRPVDRQLSHCVPDNRR